MKIVLIYMCVVSVLFSSSSATIVPIRGLKKAKVTANVLNKREHVILITDARTRADLVDQLNCSKEDPAVFYPTYSVKLSYSNNKEITIFINGMRLKINGVTYLNDKNIERMLGQIIEKQRNMGTSME